MPNSKKRRLAAVLFADIVGYTALMQHNEQQALVHLQKFKSALESHVPNHHGEIIQFYGDGCLCVFNSSVDATNCAKNLQTAFQTAPQIPVRIGLHAGDIVFRDGNVFGDAVNIASRIESMGTPGAVLFSKKVSDELNNQPDFEVQLLGSFEFKNVTKPIEVFALANKGFIIPKRNTLKGKLKVSEKKTPRWLVPALITLLFTVGSYFGLEKSAGSISTASNGPSIAVLPFTDMSKGKDQTYFADGMAEEILNTLAQLKGLKVAGRTSSFSFKNKEATIEEIGRKLNVNHVLEGSVRQQGDKIRVTAQLIKVEDGYHVWSDKYDRDFDDIFAVQDELAKSIGEILLKKLAPEQLAKLTTKPNQNSKAYALFLKAKHIHKEIYRQTKKIEDFQRSEQLFMEAIQLDSTYALAHAGLADLYDTYWIEIPEEATAEKGKYLELIEQESALAIRLNPDNAYVNLVRGYVLRRSRKTDTAFNHFIKSYELNPNDVETIIGLANMYLNMGLHEDALQFAQKTIEIEPVHRSGFVMKIYSHFYLGNLEETIKTCESLLDLEPNNLTALEYLFNANAKLGNKKIALQTLEKMERIDMAYTKNMGLDLEIALLKNDTDYLNEVLALDNANINFTVYSYQKKNEQAKAALKNASEDFLETATISPNTAPQGSLYLDFLNDVQRKPFQAEKWLQMVLAVEKEKYDFLFEKYPRATQILGK